MKVLHVGPSLHGIGGIESVIRSYVAGEWDGIEMSAVSSWDGTVEQGHNPIRTALTALYKTARAFWSDPETILHVHLSHKGSFVREGAFLLIFGRRRHVVATVHGSAFVRTAGLKHWARIYSRVLARATTVAVLNDPTLALVRQLAPSTRAVSSINPPPPALSAARKQPGACPEVAIFAGSVGRRKGVDTLMEAWGQVRRRFPNAELHLYGPLAGDVDIRSEGVVHMGSVSEQEVCAALSNARLAVLPSTAEAMPVFVIEALQAGRPTVVSDVGAMPAQIEDSGIVIKKGDAVALEHAICALFKNPSLADSLGRKALAAYEGKYSKDAISADLLEIYRRS